MSAQTKLTRPAKVLFLAANPSSTSKLALDEEIRAIEAKLRSAEHRDAFALVSRWATRPDDLLQALNELRPTIVHFSGHGGAGGELMLHGASGTPHLVQPEAVANLFRALRGDIRLVVFNACHSLAQAEAAAQEIECVIGMNAEIGDEAARVFAASFYRALGFGRSVQAAFDQGCIALQLADIAEHQTPRLITRPGVSAAALFLLAPPAMSSPAAPRVVVIAAHADNAWLKRVQMHLKPVARKAGVQVWDSSMVEAGTHVRDALAAGFASAQVVVVLVTPQLLVDDDFVDSRLGELLAAVEDNTLRLLSLIISSCAFQDTELRDYQPLNDPNEPLDALAPAILNRELSLIATRIVASAQTTWVARRR